MQPTQPMSAPALEALRIIKALRRYPTTATPFAERYALKNLSPKDLTAVVLALEEDEQGGGR